MSNIITILLAGILTENMVLAKFLGICPFLGVSKKTNTAVSMGIAVTLVMLLATAVTYPIHTYILLPYELGYLQTIVFILTFVVEETLSIKITSTHEVLNLVSTTTN